MFIRLSRTKSEGTYLMETSAKVLMEQVNFLPVDQLATTMILHNMYRVHSYMCWHERELQVGRY